MGSTPKNSLFTAWNETTCESKFRSQHCLLTGSLFAGLCLKWTSWLCGRHLSAEGTPFPSEMAPPLTGKSLLFFWREWLTLLLWTAHGCVLVSLSAVGAPARAAPVAAAAGWVGSLAFLQHSKLRLCLLVFPDVWDNSSMWKKAGWNEGQVRFIKTNLNAFFVKSKATFMLEDDFFVSVACGQSLAPKWCRWNGTFLGRLSFEWYLIESWVLAVYLVLWVIKLNSGCLFWMNLNTLLTPI